MVVPALAAPLPGHADGLLPAEGPLGPDPDLLQGVGGGAAELLVVVHQQHVPGGQPEALHVVRGGLQVQGHVEAASLVPLAGNGDGAPHLIHDVLGDGHAQAGALGALDPGAVLPGKGVEDLLLELLRHADAGVLDDEVGPDEVSAPGGILLGDGHGDAPLLRGKLHGVGEEIQQDLVEAHTVAVDVLPADVLDEDVKALLFGLHLGLDDAHDALGGLPQADHVHIQGELAALDLGHIQHVVDEAQQVLAGQGDLLQAGGHLLPVVQVGGGDGRHAHDGVHGGADVVAHVGEELALGSVGPLSLPLSMLHLCQLPP